MKIKDIFKKLKITKEKNATYLSGTNRAENSNIPMIYSDGRYTTDNMFNINNSAMQNSYYRVIDDHPVPVQSKKERIEKKPVEVWQELFEETPKIDLTGIDEKIKMVKKRFKYMEYLGGNTKDEEIALRYLNARKLFPKYGNEFVWPVTTKKKINELCSKYTLKDEYFRSYSKTIPMEAIEELEKYLSAWKNIVKGKDAKKTPDLHLIIDDSPSSHSHGERKKDPILYAESPFGSWYYVLGAWDKEVQYVDELVYKGK